MSDIDTAVVDSLKVIDLKWPIREADVESAIRLLPGSAVISNWMENRERDNVVLLAFAIVLDSLSISQSTQGFDGEFWGQELAEEGDYLSGTCGDKDFA